MRLLPVQALVVCAGLAACALRAPSDEFAHDEAIDLPITLRHNLPTLRAFVAGTPLDLFLDLGGHNAISLTAEELAQTNVQYLSKADRYRNAMGEVFTAQRFVAPNLVIGGVSFGDVEGGEYVHPSVGGPPDRNGYIGKALLTRYLIVLDYPHSRVRLYRPGNEAAFARECGIAQFAVSNRDGVISSVAYTTYGKLSVQWDTGATDNFLRPSTIGAAASAAKKVDDGSPILAVPAVTLGTEDIGPLSFRLLEFSDPAVDATFGTGLFASRKVCLDFATGRGAVASP
jgi:hypothetical protein